jgi:hypothetical protein
MVSEAQTMLAELSSDQEVRRLAEERELALKFYEMELELARDKGREEGREEGRAEAILQILSVRGIPLSTEDNARLMACRDVSALDKLVRRALTMQPGEGLFDLSVG